MVGKDSDQQSPWKTSVFWEDVSSATEQRDT